MITTVNPATGQQVAAFEPHTAEEIDDILTSAAQAQKQWRTVPLTERVGYLTKTAQVLRERKEKYAQMITLEMGKPITEARSEIEKCALTLDYYAEHAATYLAAESIETQAEESGVVFEPLGVVLAIMPWNYPFWQFFRFAAPALAAGNGAILKHANNVPQAALAAEEILRDAGVPRGLFSTVLVDSSKVAGIIADDRIAAVTLTGSTEVGAIVAGQAGQSLKKQVLELGGSDPFLVLADADVRKAAEVAVKARFTNGGQSCVNSKRFIVHDSVADEFVKLFTEGVAALKVGDPTEDTTQIGPMARANLRADIDDQVQRSIAGGAELKLGGKLLEGDGFYYAPTVLDHVQPGHAAFDEETFGPVAAIIRVDSIQQAVRLANQTEFGLAATVFSESHETTRQVVAQLEAGAVFVNGMVASDPRLPFGGIKKSGYGRELSSYGIREFTNIKTVWYGPTSKA
ncbi:NAD-dependent succinate-semialdehyde dehydrogenase [Glutamicibacter sp. NPDC087344]|uniref:NAD-dependent succinate-semialdehyde dehydrogenase n=1 Tax=Glutamicibacter sp. NPDC087344 TaxID=3363994 RepID=UPI0037FEA53C